MRAASHRFLTGLMALVLVLAGAAGMMAHAQLSGTGAISGTVVDPTGAVVVGATVTVTNIDTNVSTVKTTTRAGDYDIATLIPGTYTVTVAAAGFEGYKQENVTVDALETVGLNIKLTVGQATETVTITAAPPLLQTQDAVLGAVMDNEMYSNLPIQMSQGGPGVSDQRRATDFEYLMPGVQVNYTSNNSTDNSGIVNGSGPAGGVSEIYIEGVNLPEADQVGDPRFTWTAISVDAINQFQVQTAGYSSQFAGQGVENYSVKSGGNAIHGSLYEYNRNTLFDAWAFTNKVPTATSVPAPAGLACNSSVTASTPWCAVGGIKPREVQNEFGLVISGPILKNKLFLFGNYGQYREQHGAVYTAMSIPTSLMLGLSPTGTQLGYADYTQYALANGSAKTCTSTASEGNPANGCADIYDPITEPLGCLGTAASPCTRTPFKGVGANGVPTFDVIPGSRLSQAAQYINQYWVKYEALANQSLYTNNLNYGTPTGLANWYATGRIDYNQSAKNQVAIIVAFGRQASTGPNSVSGLGPPFNTSQAYHPVTNIDIVKDVFTVSPHIVNQAAIGYGRYESVSVTPDDAPQYAPTNSAFGLLNTPAGQASNGFPEITGVGPTLAGYAWNSKVNNTYTVTDNVQWEFGKHNFTFGGQYVDVQFDYYKSLGPTGPMDYGFSSTQTAGFSSALGLGTALLSGSGNSTASYMLGAVSSGSVLDLFIPGLGTRWRDPSFWAQDDFKVNEKLTVNLGLRWDIFPSIQEAHNIFTFFNPLGQNSITGNLGTVEFAGNGNPAQYCNCKSPSPIYWENIGPRIGFAYSVNPKTVIRGSYNVNFARGDWTSGSQSGSPGTLGVTPSGSTPLVTTTDFPVFYWDNTQCAGGTADGTTCGFNGSIAAPTPPTGGTSLAEYGTGNNSTSSASGSSISIFDPYKGARTPEFINWTFGFQRQITRDMSITVSYVGSQGHFISGGEDPPNRHNALTTNFAALAAYQPNGTGVIPCTAQTCTTPLLTTKATAANIALFEEEGFNPQNPYTGGVTYPTSSGTTGYFTAFPQYGVGDTTNFNGNTNFNALEVSLRERPAHGLDFMLNYTFSKSMDDVGSFRLNDNPRLDRSLSVTDEPENLTGTIVYLSPFGKGTMASENMIVRSLAKDWSISGIFTYHSGSPVAFTGSGCAGAPLSTCMPSPVPGWNPRTLSYNKPSGGIVAATGYPNTYSALHHLELNAFSVLDATNTAQAALTNTQLIAVGLGPAAYQVGTAARVGSYNVWGMGYYDLDIGLKRAFPIWESFKLQFEADLLNATNHVVFAGPGGAVGNGSATETGGIISGTTSYGTIGSVTNNPRDLQLSGRLSW
ncbi:MAG: TonB-dependent receptor [Acidobacteriaceae bacterium]